MVLASPPYDNACHHDDSERKTGSSKRGNSAYFDCLNSFQRQTANCTSSSAVEQPVYTGSVGGSIPSSCTTSLQVKKLAALAGHRNRFIIKFLLLLFHDDQPVLHRDRRQFCRMVDLGKIDGHLRGLHIISGNSLGVQRSDRLRDILSSDRPDLARELHG